MNQSSCRFALLVIPLTLIWFALSPQARAVCQEGCLANQNTVLGDEALANETGIDNTAVGFNALFSNTTGSFNTAVGYEALRSNTTGADNTAIGFFALFGNTTGTLNTATGLFALSSNTTGLDNTATGVSALLDNTTGNKNTANGVEALFHNGTGNNNVANGYEALNLNTTGNTNTATGAGALFNNTTGSNNIALGYSAGVNLTADNNIDIGNAGVAGEAGIIRIGTTGTQTATFIAGIRGVPISGGTEVGVDSNGQLGVRASSARYKEAIKPMDKASEAILALKPVSFRYKKEIDPDRTLEFGLIAEDVEKVSPDLVARDDQGKPFTVRYEAVNAMLLNEFLKEYRKVESLEKAMAEQQNQNAAMRAVLKEQAAQIQKVSAQLELSKSAPQTVVNNH